MKKDDTLFQPGGAEVNIIPIMSGEFPSKNEELTFPGTLPILALRNTVLFPGTIYPVTIGREKSLKLVEESFRRGMLIGAFPQKDVTQEKPRSEKDFHPYGVVAKVIKTFEMPDGSVTAIIHSLKRVQMGAIVASRPYLQCTVTYLEDMLPAGKDARLDVVADMLKQDAASLIQQSSFAPKEAVSALESIDDFGFLCNFIATTIEVEDFESKVALLSISDLKERAMRLLELIGRQLSLVRLKHEINSKVKTELDQQQREYYLNSQLRTIQEELGMDEDEEILSLKEAARKKQWPKAAAEAFDKELMKLERFNPNTPEYSIHYNFLQFFVELPWDHSTKDNLDLAHARKVLDEDHFGLEKIKERIMEYLAVLKLKGDMKSPILCLYGPPGVGKTSLGKSIARALGRKYVRISLGGVHDEAEIRGHRKTYVGALPGRILSAMHKAGSSNPVIVLDEIDKVGADYKGDPSSALLEALDPEQNTTFHDNYLDFDYDLSKVLFITTANVTSTIQPALQDRMEMINVTGYLAEEKAAIASKYLIPKQLKEHGLSRSQLKISPAAIDAVIDGYTHESGVRGLEKQIAKIARVTARKIALDEADRSVTIKPEHLREYLGLPTSFHDRQEGNEAPGVVTGLAWTPMGGEVLFVESSVSEGKGVLSTTGNLGDVMKESAAIAYQYIKAHPALAGLTFKEFSKRDIHLHVPEGAVPKDGPSAGITMVTSMVSALRGKAIRSGVAMTGEMTLRGRVLPVGGIKEKILAAKRAGVTTIIISSENKKDIEDINEIYVKGLTFVYVDTIDEVIEKVF